MDNPALPVISLFSGALGLDLGLEQVGFEIKAAVECNHSAAATIRGNRRAIALFEKKLEDVPTEELLEAAGVEAGGSFVLTGGPSCQAFSTAGQRGSMGDPRGTMFRQFLEVIEKARPRFFLMENVRGVLSAAIKHRPLDQRGPGHPPLEPDEQLGSAFMQILKEIKATGYYTVFDLVNAADFGVPQARERVLFIGSRDGEPLTMPPPTHAKKSTGDRARWATFREGVEGLGDPQPAYAEIPEKWKPYFKLVPEGGNWRDLPVDIRAAALGAAAKSWGGRSGFFRRLCWDKPSPALTTNPAGKATSLCHPTELRPLSIRECARLQQFPDTWQFEGSLDQQYIQVGNAVPVGVGAACGKVILAAMGGRADETRLGTLATSQALIKSLSNRPRTRLNPVRMREVKDLKAARDWLKGRRLCWSEVVQCMAADEIQPQLPIDECPSSALEGVPCDPAPALPSEDVERHALHGGVR